MLDMERLELDDVGPKPPSAPRLELPDDPPADQPQLAAGTGTLSRVEPVADPGGRARELAALELSFEKCLAGVNMHFQPIVHADRQLFGYESLLRSSDKSLPHPGAILDAAEQLERVTKLGRLVRNKVASVFS